MNQRPTSKQFDASPYREMIDKLDDNMPVLEFEKRSEIAVYDIIQNYEGSMSVNKGPNLWGTEDAK